MKKIFAANWKLFKSPSETREFFKSFLGQDLKTDSEVVFFPSAISLEAAATSVAGSSIQWGAQNCYSQASGAFTGENSVQVVKDLGGRYVLVGHSERRQIFKETDDLIATKLQFVQQSGLTPMLCIGETLQERESGQTQKVLETQLKKNLATADSNKALVVAYEPVWAIGTGKVATPEQVAETHQQVYSILKSLGFEKTAILYGGSVKPDNAGGLIKIPHVDGFLVGGASLEVKSFTQIIQA
jgi:triosephosphate isomerase